MNPYRKKYYSVGLISLVFLPLMCFYFLKSHQVFKKNYVLEINFPTSGDGDFQFSIGGFKKHMSDIDFLEVQLDSNLKNNKTKIDFSILEIDRIFSEKDSTTGVHFILSDDVAYQAYINILDIIKSGKKRIVLVPYKNDIWIYYAPPDPPYLGPLKKIELVECGLQSYGEDNKQAVNDSQWRYQEDYIIKRKVLFTGSLILFFAMFLLFCRNP